MAKRIVAIFSVTHAATALRDLSLWLSDQVPPGPDWKSLARPVHGLDRRIQQHSTRLLRLAGEIREQRCRGLRLGVVPNDNPAALTRLDLRIEPSRLLRRDTTEKALKKVLELLRLLAGSGWWGVNAVVEGVQTWSLRTVATEVIGLARAFGVEVAPIAFASKIDPKPSAMPGSQQVGDRPRFGKTRPGKAADDRPASKAARGAREAPTRVSVSQTSSVKTSTAKATTHKTTTSKTTTKTSAGSTTKTTTRTSTTSTKAKGTGKSEADQASARPPRQAPPADTASKKKSTGGSSKKHSKQGGSFGGLPDDEVGGAASDPQAPLSEEARLFLSYGQLTWPCAEADLRTVHRQIVKTLHPDRHPGDAAANHKFMWLQRGYESLRAKLASADAPV